MTLQSVSAFAPICNPTECPWGNKAFKGYLGEDKATWEVRTKLQLSIFLATHLTLIYTVIIVNMTELSSGITWLLGGSGLFCIHCLPCLVSFGCMLGGMLEVWMKYILHRFIEVKLLLAYEEVLKWASPSMNQNRLLFIQFQPLPRSMHNNFWMQINQPNYRDPTPLWKHQLNRKDNCNCVSPECKAVTSWKLFSVWNWRHTNNSSLVRFSLICRSMMLLCFLRITRVLKVPSSLIR